jgi:Toprim domain
LQRLANSPVIAIAEGYATAATVAKYGNASSVAAFDSGNLLAVATALYERWPDKRIMIAGDDDHKLENNPGRVKALEAAVAVNGMAIFPNLTAEQREKGMTDFNDLAFENEQLAKHQLEEAMWRARQKDEEQTGEVGKGVVRLDSWAGRREIPCEILKETPHRFLVRLGEDCLWPGGRQVKEGQEVYVPKDAVERAATQSMEATICEERV